MINMINLIMLYNWSVILIIIIILIIYIYYDFIWLVNNMYTYIYVCIYIEICVHESMGLSKVHPIWSNSAVMEQRNWEMFDFSQKTEFGRQREPVGSLKAEKHCRQWTGPLVRFLQLWCEQRKLCLGLQCWDWGWNKASQDEGHEGYVYICLHDFRCTNVTKQYETGTT